MLDKVTEQILSRWPVGVLSTYGRDSISSVPIVFVALGDVLFSPIDAKPKSGAELARIRNLRSHPAYTLLLQNYEENWERLWWLKVLGTAGLAHEPREIASAINALGLKYPQYAERGLMPEEPALLRLEIVSVVSWAYQGEGFLAREFA